MIKCGLLGRKLAHSYSPQIHSQLGNYSYTLFEKEPEEIEGFLKNGDFTGINVTTPYKKAVIPFLSELSPIAARLGAVNTIIRKGEKLIGHNTDYFGFLTMVRSSGLQLRSKKVLVLGSGGASNTVCAVLKELGSRVVIISRSGENNYRNLHLHADASVIVNTTPVGMYPHTGITPLDLDGFPKLEGVLDVIYNPARTKLLMDAQNRGLVAVNGLLMLVAQAKEASEWFTGMQLEDDRISAVHTLLQRQMENIVLIGMPGSGKTTVGRLLAERLGMEFVDSDAVLIEDAGRSIAEIFTADGETGFRALETRVLEQIGQRSGLVIATGGGCVTQERNYPLLHQNGTIIYLRRQTHKLPTDGRPLSQTGSVEEMFRIRRPMYEAFADYATEDSDDPNAVVDQILSILEGTK